MLKLIFTEKVLYDRVKKDYRTTKVNAFFELINKLFANYRKEKSGKESIETNSSAYVHLTPQLSNFFIEDFIACVELSKKINERV